MTSRNAAVSSSPAIFHPGPAIAYLAKVPAGVDAADFDGKGAVWFKFWQDEPDVTPSGLEWPTMRAHLSSSATGSRQS